MAQALHAQAAFADAESSFVAVFSVLSFALSLASSQDQEVDVKWTLYASVVVAEPSPGSTLLSAPALLGHLRQLPRCKSTQRISSSHPQEELIEVSQYRLEQHFTAKSKDQIGQAVKESELADQK